MPLSVLICEDEPLARETLRGFLAAWPDLRLTGEAADGAQALALARALDPDLLLLDIQMPELTGLEVLRRLDRMPQVVFTTAWDHHAVTAFELNAVDYLLKPFSQERFDAAMRRVLDEHRARAERAERSDLADAAAGPLAALGMTSGATPPLLSRILVRDRGRIFPLTLAQIEYLRADTKYTAIVTGGRSFLVRVALADLEQRLPAERFLRIHRSTIVNLDYVASMKADEQSQLMIEMKDGTQLVANREASRRLRDLAI